MASSSAQQRLFVVSKFCYLFPKIGMPDFTPHLDNEILSFSMPSVFHPERNNFYQLDAKLYESHLGILTQTVIQHIHATPAPLSLICVFVSAANGSRILKERQPMKEYQDVVLMYEDAIRLSGDDSAIKILALVAKHPKTIVVCSTDDETSGLIPSASLELVAEAFAGLSMCAVHEGRTQQAVSYATAALFKHQRYALPLISCVRLMAIWQSNMELVVELTRMAILPHYIRMGADDLYELEGCLWEPQIFDAFGSLPSQVARTAADLSARYAGQRVVVKAKYRDNAFVAKLCLVCGKGADGEKLFSCVRCGRAYYCGKACQRAHWGEHRRVCKA